MFDDGYRHCGGYSKPPQKKNPEINKFSQGWKKPWVKSKK